MVNTVNITLAFSSKHSCVYVQSHRAARLSVINKNPRYWNSFTLSHPGHFTGPLSANQTEAQMDQEINIMAVMLSSSWMMHHCEQSATHYCFKKHKKDVT